ncbi:MAG TPA: hemerythrin domain-containing protein [Drouetiella sp.]
MKDAKEKQLPGDLAGESSILDILHREHTKVDDMFFKFSKSEDNEEKKQIVEQIALELGLHAKAEEEIVYPAVRDGKEEVEDMMDEADTEHHVVKFLLAELRGMEPTDDHYDAKVTVLCELVKHHVAEEEEDIFEKLKNSKQDLDELGEKFMQRKMQLAAKPLPEDAFPVKSTQHKKTA